MNKETVSLLLIWQIFTLGVLIFLVPTNKITINRRPNQPHKMNLKLKIKKYENQLASVSCAFISFLLLQLLCETVVISLPLSILAGSFPWIKSTARERRKQKSVQDAWPEALDHINSAIKSGVPISQALANLAERGPTVLSPFFREYKAQLNSSGNLELALKNLCLTTQDPILKRLTQTILLVRNVGGVQVGSVLRTFTTFLRNDLTAKRETEMRHGWIANTARIASVAPWILLIFLTFQPQTRTAYNTLTGAIVVLGGSFVIAIAYLWMSRTAKQVSSQ